MATYGSTWRSNYRRPRRAYAPGRGGFGRPKVQGYAQQPTRTGMVAAQRPVVPPAPPKPPPGPQPLPFDPVYEGDVSLAQRSYGNAQAGLSYQRLRTQQEYGIDDPSDPFSKAASLKRNYEQGQRRTLNTLGNNLYSSSGQTNLDEGTRSYNQAYSGMRRAYDDTLFGLTQQENEAALARDAAIQAALAGRIERAPRPEDPGEEEAATAAVPPKPGAKPKPKRKLKPGLHTRWSKPLKTTPYRRRKGMR